MAVLKREVDWTFIKSLVDANNMKLHYIENDVEYLVFTINGQIVYETALFKAGTDVVVADVTQNAADLTDFENNYKADANAYERLSITANFEDDINLDVNVKSQVLSKDIRYDQMTANQALTLDTYVTIYEYAGTGQFYGFYSGLADSDVDLRVTIDGTEIIDDFLLSNLPIAGPGGSGGGPFSSIFLQRSEGSEFNMQPPMAIKYGSSIKIELNAHASSESQRKMVFGYVVLTKE